MSSIFGHTIVAVTIAKKYPRKLFSWKFLFLGIFCAILPDIDVIAFKLGIPYANVFGHRGITHSLLFAFILGFSVTLIFYRKNIFSLKGLTYFSFFSLCAISHDILDAMTNGGLGVGFFIPWDETRYFLPWRPIQVSPIGVKNFMAKAGLILKNEFIYIGIPCFLYLCLLGLIRKKKF